MQLNLNQTAQSQADKRVRRQTENVQGIYDIQEGQLKQKKISTLEMLICHNCMM